MSRSFVLLSAISLGFTWSAPVAAQTPDGPAAQSNSPGTAAPSSAGAAPETPRADGSSPSTASATETNPTTEGPPETLAPTQPEPAPSESEEAESGEVAAKAATTAAAPETNESAESVEEEPAAPYDGPATLLDGDRETMHIGGYGGLAVLGTSINKSGGLLIGGEGALLLDHRLALGLAGYGLTSEVRGPDFASGDTSILGFGYGGAVFRYHLVSKRIPVTASVGTLIGAGGLTLIQKVEYGDFEYEYDYQDDTPANAFFIAEPSLQVNLHLTKWMRLGVSGGYRFVRGPSLRGISDADLEGVTAGGHVQFGWF